MASSSRRLVTGPPPAAPDDHEHADLLRNFGEHKLMESVQAALKKQLTSQLRRVEAELREQEEARDKAQRARQHVGVELYGVQQQLARLQTQLDAAGGAVVALHDIRSKAEGDLKTFQAGYASRKAQIDSEEARLEKFKGELDGILDTVRQVERYQEDVAAEIALNRRTTHKTDEALIEREKAKAKQDHYIDDLTRQLQRSTAQLAALEAQIASQRSESATAGEAMSDAAKEMEGISAEKRQLMLQWQSTLIAMRRRDEALQATHKATREQSELLDSMDAEENNVRRAIAAAQDGHARLQDQFDKEDSQLKYIETQMAQMQRQNDGLQERQAALSGALEQTDAEVKRLAAERDALLKAMRDADAARATADRARFGIEDEINEHRSNRTTHEKAARALLKGAKRLSDQLHDLELQSAAMENDIAAAKVESLNTSARISGLRDGMVALEGDLRDKERLVERYELEIRQRHDAIDKKMAIVDRLNRKFEKMVADTPEAESTGPLQAEIHNLNRAIAAKREANDALQRRWLADQTALVNAANDAEAKASRLRDLTSHAVLLDQKRIRMDGAVETQKGELRRLEGAIKTMHDDMARINALIAKNEGLSKKLASAVFMTERVFSEELREMEAESAAADARVEALRGEKERLLTDLVECERQVALWEKKIELEREMQAALDPRVGESEIAAMEKEIHRMRLRQDALQREQERLVAEMHRAIDKREVIHTKHKSAKAVTLLAAAAAIDNKGASSSSSGGIPAGSTTLKGGGPHTATRAGMHQRAALLRQEIATKLAQASELEAALLSRAQEASAAAAVVSERSAAVDSLEDQAATLQSAINVSLYEKQKGVEQVAALTRLLQRLEAHEAGKAPPLTSEEAARVGERLREAEVARDRVRALVQNLSLAHGDLAEVLHRVGQLIDLAPALV